MAITKNNLGGIRHDRRYDNHCRRGLSGGQGDLGKARLEQGELFVVGCSTSEVGGATIGTYSSPELAEMVFGGIYQATQEAGVYLAAQCCEHLNRALILEKRLR